MTWSGVLGHDDVVERLRRSIQAGRLASTYLFVGPAGVGKRTFALKLAQALLCPRHADAELIACDECPSCRQVLAGSNPDVLFVDKPEDKSFIPVERFIGDREHRMQRGLCYDISLKPYGGRRKIAIIDDADYLNQEGANCLLKTLEEPPPHSLLILIGTSQQRQLPTIRSRCQVLRFRPLAVEHVRQLLLASGIVATDAEADELAPLGHGSLAVAASLAAPEMRQFRQYLMGQLAQDSELASSLAKEVNEFVDQAGKEAPLRRARMKHIIAYAVDFFRGLLLRNCGADDDADPALRAALDAAAAGWQDAERVAGCLERCVDAVHQVDSNANQATLVECWLDDLLFGTRSLTSVK